jgi:hypothetical protein
MKNIKINVKPIYKIGKGHSNHISGSGNHDNRPNRLRTRGSANRKYINEEY